MLSADFLISSAERKRKRLEEMNRSNVMDGVFEAVGEGHAFLSWLATHARRVKMDYGINTTEDIERLSILGASGASQQNIERDLERWLRNLYDHRIEPYPIKLELDWDGVASSAGPSDPVFFQDNNTNLLKHKLLSLLGPTHPRASIKPLLNGFSPS